MRILFFILLLCLPAGAEPLDRVVAVVGDQLVLASDVDLLHALWGRDPLALPIWSSTPTRAIDTAAVRELAGDVSVYAPRPEQVTSRLDSVRDTFETYDAFTVFLTGRGMTEGDLVSLLRRRLVVEKFVQRNLDMDPADPKYDAAVADLFESARERVVIREIPKKSE